MFLCYRSAAKLAMGDSEGALDDVEEALRLAPMYLEVNILPLPALYLFLSFFFFYLWEETVSYLLLEDSIVSDIVGRKGYKYDKSFPNLSLLSLYKLNLGKVYEVGNGG